MSRFFVAGSNHSAKALEGGAGSASGKSNSSPSGKMPAAREITSSPSLSSSWLMTSSLKPQAQNFSACKRKFKVSSINLSCVCKCWGVRKVPLVQMTGCNCFIELPDDRRVGYVGNAPRCFPAAAHNNNYRARKQRQIRAAQPWRSTVAPRRDRPGVFEGREYKVENRIQKSRDIAKPIVLRYVSLRT